MIKSKEIKSKNYCKGCLELQRFLSDIALDIINLKNKLNDLEIETCKVEQVVDEFAEIIIFFIEEYNLDIDDRRIDMMKEFLIQSLNTHNN